MSTEAGTEKTRKTRKPTPKLADVLGGAGLEAEVLATGNWKREVTRTVPRDEYQLKLDKDGKRLYSEWLKKGRPEDLDDCPNIGYRVNPDAVPVLTAYLRRVVGAGGPLSGKFLSVRTESGAEDGRVLVKCIYKDKPEKAAS